MSKKLPHLHSRQLTDELSSCRRIAHGLTLRIDGKMRKIKTNPTTNMDLDWCKYSGPVYKSHVY